MTETIGPYVVKQKLGSGGMGDVYLGEDVRLHRPVALKVLPPEVSADPQRRTRFLQEAHAASAINHPNVCTIYEVGESGSSIFIAMEFIDGKTLAQVRQGREVSSDEVIDIAIQAADALDEARARGIIHRDIKSANIMLTTRGHVKVLDFGLAKITRPVAGDASETKVKTSPGLVVGTSMFMSPEQALGRPVDHRSDLFSLGIVLYELLTGRLPFVGNTTTETIEKIAHAQPEAISRFNYSVPPGLERIIRKLLEKDPERRYQTARELMVDLKNLKRDTSSGEVTTPEEPRRRAGRAMWLVIAVAAAAFTAAGLFIWRSRPLPAGDAIDSIAVLPFVNTGRNADAEYLSEGISESISNNLSRISNLRVVPRSTAFRYKGRDADPAAVARDLKVRAIVSGTLLQRGDTISVQTELVDTQTDAQIWGARYERKVTDALALQEEISQQISDALRLRIAPADAKRVAQPPTSDAEAYELYLKGRFEWNKRTGESLRKALAFFREAAQRDPQFALAHVGVGDSLVLLEEYADQPMTSVIDEAEAEARRALEIDPSLAEPHATLAFLAQSRWQWNLAEEEFRRSIAANPRYATGRHWYSILLRHLGRRDEALAQIREAQKIDPLSMIIGANVMEDLSLTGKTDEAIETAEHYLQIDPEYAALLSSLAMVYARAGRETDALSVAKHAMNNAGRTGEQLSNVASAYAYAGQRAPAMELLNELKQRESEGKANPYHVAAVYAALGDRAHAFEYLDRCIARRSDELSTQVTIDYQFEPLRSDPRYTQLMRKMNLH